MTSRSWTPIPLLWQRLSWRRATLALTQAVDDVVTHVIAHTVDIPVRPDAADAASRPEPPHRPARPASTRSSAPTPQPDTYSRTRALAPHERTAQKYDRARYFSSA